MGAFNTQLHSQIGAFTEYLQSAAGDTGLKLEYSHDVCSAC